MTQPLRKDTQPDLLDTPLAASPAAAPEAAGDLTSAAPASGVGDTLRRLREARGLSPADVSSRLKFSQRQLDALETGKWDRLPKGMPLRGFVKNYARYLEADLDAIMLMLEQEAGVTAPKPVVVGGGLPVRGGDLPAQEEAVHRPWGWLFVILALLLAAGFYAIQRGWVPDSWLIFDWLKALKQ